MTIDEAIQFHQKQEKIQNRLYESEWINEKDKLHCLEYAEHEKQLAEWLIELKEAKRLLKATVEDFSNIYDHIFDCDGMCDTCPIHGNRDTCDKWVCADEALKLIGGRSNDTDM